MKIDAIIFDKDGTLIDFDAFWVSISVAALGQLLKELGREDIPVEALLGGFGVKDGVTPIDSVLCKGTYRQMADVIRELLGAFGCEVPEEGFDQKVKRVYTQNMSAGTIMATVSNLADLLQQWKEAGIKLAVVTTDNDIVTKKCLEELGIDVYFARIYADDGHTPQKPDPYCADDFSIWSGVKKERMLMVGDTMTDVQFAKNAGISMVGVGKTAENREILGKAAETVISSLTELLDMIE